MHPQNDSPFFALPREIRNKIVMEYLPPSRGDYLLSPGHFREPYAFLSPVPLVLTCKRMFSEAQPLASSRPYIRAFNGTGLPLTGLFSSGAVRLDRIGYLRITLDCCCFGKEPTVPVPVMSDLRPLIERRLPALEEVEIEPRGISFKALFRRRRFFYLLLSLSQRPTVRTIRLLGRGPREWPKRYRRLVKPKTASDPSSTQIAVE
ncbi:hypothetical protein ACJ41O_000625 [Fusarium nematophilum]